MSDTTPPAQPEPTPPNTGNAAPAGSPYTPQPASAPSPKQGLSLTSFIAGLAGLIIFSWIPVLGFLVPLTAVIIGFMAKGKEPGAPKWMWLIGVISGFVGIVVGIIILLAWLLPLLIFGAAISDMSTYSY